MHQLNLFQIFIYWYYAPAFHSCSYNNSSPFISLSLVLCTNTIYFMIYFVVLGARFILPTIFIFCYYVHHFQFIQIILIIYPPLSHIIHTYNIIHYLFTPLSSTFHSSNYNYYFYYYSHLIILTFILSTYLINFLQLILLSSLYQLTS